MKAFISAASEGGIPWDKLTPEQRHEVVKNFYQREPIGTEKTSTFYHFDDKGKCVFAD